MSDPAPGDRRRTLVTGASAGIGAAIARAFGARGWSVALGARRTDRLAAVARDVEQAGGRPFVHALDVTQPASIEAFVAAAEEALGGIDLLVSNAGIGIPARLHEIAVAQLQHEIATNLVGPLLLARAALPAMLARGSGDLVFVSSMNAVAPRPFQVGYTASKAGLEGAVQNLRMDLEGSGLRAMIVRPGPTRSEFGAGWETNRLVQVLESWRHWGLIRHNEILAPERVADAIVHAVCAPPGAETDLIQINPEGPRGT